MHRHIDRQHQRAEPGIGGALDQVIGDLAVPRGIELIPGVFRRDSGGVLDRLVAGAFHSHRAGFSLKSATLAGVSGQSYRVSRRFSTIRNSAGLTCAGPVRRRGTALRSAAGLFQFGADVPQFREEDPAGDLLEIADPGGAAGAALLADDARDDLEMAVAP